MCSSCNGSRSSGFCIQIDLSDGKIIGGAPVGIHLAQFFRGKTDCR